MLDKYLIQHCSPTLASLKTANLFTFHYISDNNLYNSINQWNKILNAKGIKLFLLRKKKKTALIYVYRKKFLETDLKQPETFDILKAFGYKNTDTLYALNKLKERICKSDSFPHEIGLFLGYPIEDVQGFIKHNGKNCKCVGCWKVYCNECEALQKFAKYKKCTVIYTKHWANGKSISDLSVCA